MDSATQLELNAINRRFYAAIASEWSGKRKHPWPGWERVWNALPAERRAAMSGGLRVLDLGCGDGRLLAFLTQRASDVDYLGIDASAALLERARKRELAARSTWLEADFIMQPLPESALETQYDLICVFGVLHHVPAHERRVQLVRELASLLRDRGTLALTFWRLDEDPRFASRRVRFEDYNRSAQQPIALDQLEPGDTLLRWGDRDAPPRYCHFPGSEHIQALIETSGLHMLERFRADGHQNRLNEYVLLTAAHK
jgi:SAM-dependent methyltransferase